MHTHTHAHRISKKYRAVLKKDRARRRDREQRTNHPILTQRKRAWAALTARRNAVIGLTVAHTSLDIFAIAAIIADYAPGWYVQSTSVTTHRVGMRAAKRRVLELRRHSIIGQTVAYTPIGMYSIAAIIADYEPGFHMGYDIPIRFEGVSIMARDVDPYGVVSATTLGGLNQAIARWESRLGDDYPLYVYRISGTGIELGLNRVPSNLEHSTLAEIHNRDHSPDGLIIISRFVSKLMM
jgi:hypothetical protein